MKENKKPIVQVHRIRGKRSESVIVNGAVAEELVRIGIIERAEMVLVPKNPGTRARVIYYRKAR